MPRLLVPTLIIGGVLTVRNIVIQACPLPDGMLGLLGGDILHTFGKVALVYDQMSPYLEGEVLPQAASLVAAASP